MITKRLLTLSAVGTETREKSLRIYFIKMNIFLAMNELLPNKCLDMQVAQRDVYLKLLKDNFLKDNETLMQLLFFCSD